MSSSNKAKIMLLQKLSHNISSKRERYSSVILTPTSDILSNKNTPIETETTPIETKTIEFNDKISQPILLWVDPLNLEPYQNFKQISQSPKITTADWF